MCYDKQIITPSLICYLLDNNIQDFLQLCSLTNIMWHIDKALKGMPHNHNFNLTTKCLIQ